MTTAVEIGGLLMMVDIMNENCKQRALEGCEKKTYASSFD